MRQLRVIKQITNREAHSLDKYLLEIGKIQLLSSDEEIYLSQQIKAGSHEALDTLVKSNLRFVISVAKQYQNQGLPLSDLIDEGNLGLIKAAKRFDATKGFKFISYAVWWIRQAILQALAEQARIIKLPQNKVDIINKINRTFTRLEQEFQREPTVDEIADILEMNTFLVDQSLNSSAFHFSLDAPLYDDEENENSQYDLYSNEFSPSPDNDLLETSLKIEIERLLCKLDTREADILSSIYGLNGKQALALDDIGRTFGLTRERVRQIRDNSIRKLKNIPFLTILKPFLG
ncbi:MAG: RNA polymerase sigma factor RpoD/SigA [Bacteroidetes bacterium]|nr:RNA polymerase sigma factor RpoD/SigA [Bacteroidota bacterium]MCL6103816.1 RNA polymerase sigma factor RpoD/SigA [Bacteroidota bacterium]